MEPKKIVATDVKDKNATAKEDKRVNLNYTVSQLTSYVKRIEEARLITEEEAKTMKDIANKAVKRHISIVYGLDME